MANPPPPILLTDPRGCRLPGGYQRSVPILGPWAGLLIVSGASAVFWAVVAAWIGHAVQTPLTGPQLLALAAAIGAFVTLSTGRIFFPVD